MDALKYLVSVGREIPATFWGVVVGAFFSILGVALTNWASEKRLRRQFEHERTLKAKEREIVAKREIYLAAAASIASRIQLLSLLSNPYHPDEKVLAPLQDASQAVSKVLLVASSDTARAFAKLNGALTILFLNLYPKRAALIVEKAKLDALDAQIAKSQRDQESMLEKLKQYNLSGETDRALWDRLVRSGDAQSEWIRNLLDRRTEEFKALASRQLELGIECDAARVSLRPLLAPAIGGVRREIDLPMEDAVLNEVLEDAAGVSTAQAEAFARLGALAGLENSSNNN